uniref:Fucolectin tachylectin-4 pentraxin-1 domain-containing protein n=1 Tax=Sphaeramia orbicularis TaxID=375764 RepID=A0A672Z3S0_9TELE
MKNRCVLFLMLVLRTYSAHNYGKKCCFTCKATQSYHADLKFGAANAAINGNHDSVFSARSCSHAKTQTNPWWRVELLEHNIVTSITITNRGDCCAEWTDGAEIHIGSSILHNGAANPVVSVISQIPLVLPGPNKVLILCEVEVYWHCAPTELALSGKATQSSVHANGIPYNAIDGNRASRWNQGSCIHTGPDFNPWWRLDLRKTHKVFSVIITNIVDAHSARLNGAEIRIGDSLENNGNDNPRYFTDHIPAGFTQNFQCPGMDGHYVNVVIPGRGEYLHICEVEVYGSPLD